MVKKIRVVPQPCASPHFSRALAVGRVPWASDIISPDELFDE